MTASLEYTGELHCHCTHLQSGSSIETDAPTDNRGKGERFSPTDLLCVSLGTCMITTMAIKATDMGIELKGTQLEVTKTMYSDPRRVGEVSVVLHLPALNLDEKDKAILERTGNHCPVMKSIHPDVQVRAQYLWG
ncbi:MAG TPA: OsmC family protein [Ferruginibacter sp.]|nr:OsmC family protein [Ferruginibacter sp.]HRO17405.1 OsmC family protein [Ferruginibacter sp.]